MNIEDILTLERTFCKIQATSRKRALEQVAEYLAANIPFFDSEQLFTNLIAREKMGSTALGHGIAIPHCRMQGCDKILGGIFSLDQPIDFESPDRSQTSLLFVLVVPEEETSEHLHILATLASRFDSEPFRQSLFAANSAEDLYRAAIANPQPKAKQARS